MPNPVSTSIRRRYSFEAAWREQRKSARRRGIPFQLTFEQWFEIWLRSGHLHERGCRQGQYVMARLNDTGPYAPGNVKIILHVENSREWERTLEYRERKRLESTGRRHSASSKRLMSESRGREYRGGNKKITAELASEIRLKYQSARNQSALAREYGISQAAIWRIVTNKSWRAA